MVPTHLKLEVYITTSHLLNGKKNIKCPKTPPLSIYMYKNSKNQAFIATYALLREK